MVKGNRYEENVGGVKEQSLEGRVWVSRLTLGLRRSMWSGPDLFLSAGRGWGVSGRGGGEGEGGGCRDPVTLWQQEKKPQSYALPT